MNENKKILISIGLVFLIVFNLSQIFSEKNLNINNRTKSSAPEDISFDSSSLTVPYGTNVQQYYPTTFSGNFYDITNDYRVWNDDCYVETCLVADPDVCTNYTYTPDNTEQYNASYSDITMNQGTLDYNGTLNELDDDYSTFNASNEDCHYNGTYSFTGETGQTETSIGFVNYINSGADAIVIDELDGHEEVINISVTTAWHGIRNYYDAQTSGTIEFWFYMDGLPHQRFYVYDTVAGAYWYCYVDCNYHKLYVRDGTSTYGVDDFPIVNDEWYHMKLIFDCSVDEMDIYVNGTLCYENASPDNNNDMVGANQLRLSIYSGYVCMDAVGYSWDSNYVVGDNWFYNSFNGTYNFENVSTQDFVYEGTYDFNNITMEEDIYYGTYDFNNITMEEDIYYGTHDFNDLSTEAGYYYGAPSITGSFEGETGETGIDVSFIDYISASATAEVISEEAGHNEVLNVSSDTAGNGIRNYLSVGQSSGTMEYWIKPTETTEQLEFAIYQDGSNYLYYRFRNNGQVWIDGVDRIAYTAEWHHIKVEFNCGSNSYKFYYDGFYLCDVNANVGNPSQINRFYFSVSTVADDTSFFLDAVGYSWDFNYQVGYNINPYDIDDLLTTFDYLLMYCNTSISITDVGNHNNALLINDSSLSNDLRVYDVFDDQTSGIVEFWIRTNDSDCRNTVLLRTGSTTVIFFTIRSGYLQCYDTTYRQLLVCSVDTWYHVKIEFDCSSDDATFYINGFDCGTYDFYGGADFAQVNRFHLQSYNSFTSLLYVDAIGYSWDDYVVGYNVNPYDLTDFISLTSSITLKNNASISIEDLGSHNNVVDLSSINTANSVQYIISFDSQTTGTIELWFRKNTTITSYLILNNQNGNTAIYMVLQDYIKYYDSSLTLQTITAISINTWYHLRIDFDCDSDLMDLYLNGNLYSDLEFEYARDDISQLRVVQGSNSVGASFYIDAIGLDWDTTSHDGLGYSVGYNINPYNIIDLLESGFEFDLGYDTCVNITDVNGHFDVLSINDFSSSNLIDIYNSYEDQDDGTIEFWVHNTATSKRVMIRLTQDESVKIWLRLGSTVEYHNGVGYQDLGYSISANTWYHFSLYFDCLTDTFDLKINGILYDSLDFYSSSVDLNGIEVLTTSSYTDYIVSIDALSFSWDTNYDIGDNQGAKDLGSDWFIFNSDNCNASIVAEESSHKKILSISDYSSTYRESIYQYFDSDKTSGTIEFWFKKDDPTDYAVFTLYYNSGATQAIYIHVDDYFAYYDTATQDIEEFIEDIWYHIRIDFDCSTDTFDLTINDNVYSDLDFRNAVDSIDVLYIQSHTTNTDYAFYIDALSYSWDTNYDIGDNLWTDLYFELDFTIELDVDADDLLAFLVSAYYMTTIYTMFNFSIYDYENSEWYQINSSYNYIYFYESSFTDDSTELINYINDDTMLFWFYGVNMTYDFNFYIDMLNVTFYNDLIVSSEITLSLLGLWKYRFHIPEESYSTSWIYFNVIQHEDNFMAISESDFATSWILICNETEVGTTLIYSDNMEGNNWHLYDSSDVLHEDDIIAIVDCTDDSYVDSNLPDSNKGSQTYTYNSYATGSGAKYYSVFQFENIEDAYEYIETSYQAHVNLYVLDVQNDAYSASLYLSHLDGNFDESTITYNILFSEYHTGDKDSDYMSTSALADNTWHYFETYNNSYYSYSIVHVLAFPNTWSGYVQSSSKEGSYDPYMSYQLKSIVQDSDYTLCQTNKTEILKMKSDSFTDVSLEANDYFEIKLSTSLSDLDMQLLNGGSLVKTINLLENNINEEEQTVTFSLSEELVFDQIIFTEEFNERDFLKVSSIQTYTYESETQEEIETYYIAPESSQSIYLDVGYYNLKIYDNDILRVNKYITITHDIQDNLELYTPIYSIECRVTFVNQENEYLDISLFQVYITKTLSNYTSRSSLLDVYFRADVDTYITFEIYDRFSVSIKNETVSVAEFIFIEIELYTLKIMNDATNYLEVSIERQGTSLEIEDVFSPNELILYSLVSDYYQVSVLNKENDVATLYNVSLVEDIVLTINSVFHSVYFAPFTDGGIGLQWNTLKFYINDSRKDFGFNVLQSDYVNITVLDFLNEIAFSQVLDLSGVNEYNIYINVGTLKIKNDATNYTQVWIRQQGKSYTIGEVLAPNELIIYNLIPSNYTIMYLNYEDYSNETYALELVLDAILTIPSVFRQVYFAPFLGDGLGLDWSAVRFYLNGSRKDFGFNTIQSDYMNITVLDYFNQTAYSEVADLTDLNEYNIYIDLLSFKIINKATEIVNFTLTKNSLTETGNIFSNEIIEYLLVDGTYSFAYTNHENMESETLSIVLSSDYWLEINTTYFDVYFAVFNFDGLGLDTDMFRFYINGQRSDFGFSTMTQHVNNLQVLDYFNSSLFNQNIDLEGASEYNILVEVYTLIINNNYNRSVRIEIERGNIAIEQVIPMQSGLSYRFLPNIVYDLEVFDLDTNEMLYDEDITLNENNKVVSFGFYETIVPEIPQPFDPANYMVIFWAFIIVIIVVVIVLGLYLQARKEVSEELGVKTRRKSGSKEILYFNNQQIK